MNGELIIAVPETIMEVQRNLGSVPRRAPAAEAHKADLSPKRRTARDPSVAAKSATTVDARIGSLKILAQSLMRQIELLENEAASGHTSDFDVHSEVQRFEAELIRSALTRTGGRQRRAARLLGMKVTTLNTKIKRYKITLDLATIVHDNNSELPPEESLKVS